MNESKSSETMLSNGMRDRLVSTIISTISTIIACLLSTILFIDNAVCGIGISIFSFLALVSGIASVVITDE